jgi:NADH-quinone oxidoreductase subunit K
MSDFWILNMGFVALLFAVGLYCLLTMKNLIRMLIGVEILSKGIMLALVATGYEKGLILTSQSLAVSFIVVEVCVLATALAVIVNIHRHLKNLNVEQLSKLKG